MKHRHVSLEARRRSHSKRRALERYGIDVKTKELAYLASLIKGGHATHLRKASGRISIWQVQRTTGEKLTVAYDEKKRAIASFLPKDSREARLADELPFLAEHIKNDRARLIGMTSKSYGVWEICIAEDIIIEVVYSLPKNKLTGFAWVDLMVER